MDTKCFSDEAEMDLDDNRARLDQNHPSRRCADQLGRADQDQRRAFHLHYLKAIPGDVHEDGILEDD